jgi:glycosyltransferase involved in cell wall biosynthesis
MNGLRIVLDARATGSHFPGVARATFGLLGGLAAIEHPHRFAVLAHGDDPPVAHPAFRDPRFTRVRTAAAPLGLAQQWQLPLLARSLRADVWHAPYYVRPFVGLQNPIVTVFDIIGYVVPGALSWRSRLLFEATMRLSLLSAAQIITSSHATKRDLERHYRIAPGRVTVIPLAADRVFRPQSATRIGFLREQYDLPPRYLLYLGSNKPHKNLATLIAAFSRVQTDATLVIAGRWDRRYNEPERLAAFFGDRVRWLHDIADDDVPALLSGATGFVFPSRYEGFGLPPLEAMACGTPVIASNVSSLPEVVGDAGLLVAPNVSPLAEAMQRLLDDPALRDDLRDRGLKRAALFSWEATARRTIAVYERSANTRE